MIHVHNVVGRSGKLLARFVMGAPELGVEFPSAPEEALQVGYLSHLAGKEIRAHTHKAFPRNSVGNVEVIIVLKGWLTVDIYDDDDTLLVKYDIGPGESVTLLGGGHGFECASDCLLFEVKQGPYSPDKEYIGGSLPGT